MINFTKYIILEMYIYTMSKEINIKLNNHTRLILTDIHPVLSEITKFLPFDDNLNFYCSWGKYCVTNDSKIWEYSMRRSYA